jgi:hypothetical protein
VPNQAFFGTFRAYISTKSAKKSESTRSTKAPGAFLSGVAPLRKVQWCFWGVQKHLWCGSFSGSTGAFFALYIYLYYQSGLLGVQK